MSENWLSRGWTWIGNAATAYGLIPVGVSAAVGYALARIAGLPAAIGLVIALAIIACSLIIIRLMARQAAYIVLACALLGFTGMASYQYGQFSIDYQDVQVGLIPYTPDLKIAQGAQISPSFGNENAFDLWWKADRHDTTVNGPNGQQISNSDQTPLTGVAPKKLAFTIPDKAIQFNQPMYASQATGGNIDYHVCYGRTEMALTQSLTFKASYTTAFDEKGVHAHVHIIEFKQGKCEPD